ncbi:MAG: S41 family peptidase [Chloroflexota bacterium]|nr:S41 family peptidase [Chloroflexota bacterium]
MKKYRLTLLLALVTAIVLVVTACVSRSSGEAELGSIWQAWSELQAAGDAPLSVQTAAAGAIQGMLIEAEEPPYPFLVTLRDRQPRVPTSVPKGMEDVWRTWEVVRQKQPDLDAKTLASSAIRGMVASVGITSSAYLDAEAYVQAKESIAGKYEGIGAYVRDQDGEIVIIGTFAGGPAERAGLKAGDVIEAVSGESVQGRSLEEAVALVRGPEGSQVTLRVRSPGQEPREVEVTRGTIQLSSVDWQLLPGAIGYLTIVEFRQNTPEALTEALEDFKKAEGMALILDLRGNPGGDLAAAISVASQFLKSGIVMYEVDNQGNRADLPVEEGGLATDIPMAVLVDQFSASASEVVAGALQDYGRARVFGSQTYGKGTTNTFRELADGSAIYVPVAHWYTPLGRQIEGVGIEPDEVVTPTPQEQAQGVDAPLVAAYDYLDAQLPLFR